jgi:hypothetical protein
MDAVTDLVDEVYIEPLNEEGLGSKPLAKRVGAAHTLISHFICTTRNVADRTVHLQVHNYMHAHVVHKHTYLPFYDIYGMRRLQCIGCLVHVYHGL